MQPTIGEIYNFKGKNLVCVRIHSSTKDSCLYEMFDYHKQETFYVYKEHLKEKAEEYLTCTSCNQSKSDSEFEYSTVYAYKYCKCCLKTKLDNNNLKSFLIELLKIGKKLEAEKNRQ